MPDRIGQRLGNYRLTRLLGQGSFADVYLGEHIHLKTKAAIKVLAMRLVSRNMDQFLTEAQTIASLVHPDIVRVLEFGIEDDTPFMVMDYAPNGTLRQRHPHGTALSPASIVAYVKQIAAALQYAHDRKLIHRDVKPENMLLGQNNDVLLSDFGLALIAQSTEVQITQAMAGTLPYMAPEQFRGKPRPASDQYALGIVVYTWLSGDHPFHGPFLEIASQHILTPPPPLLAKVPTVSPAIQEVVQIALAKDPHQRFASVQAFATAFAQACQEKQTHPLMPSIVTPPPSQPSQPAMPAITPPSQRLTVPAPLLPEQSALPSIPADLHKEGTPTLFPTAKLADIGFTSIPTWPPGNTSPPSDPSSQPDKVPSPFRWLNRSRETPLPFTLPGQWQPRRRAPAQRKNIGLSIILFLVAAVLLTMSGVFAFLLLALPTASIHFSAQTHLVSQVFQLTVNPSITAIDATSRSIPAKTLNESKTGTQTGPATYQSCFGFGTNNCQQLVSYDDVYSLANQIQASLQSQISHDLQKQLQADGATQVGHVQFSNAQPTWNPSIGSPAPNGVTVTLTEQGSVEYFLNKDAQALALQLLLKQMQAFGANYVPVDSTIRIGQPVVAAVGGGSGRMVTVDVAAAGYVGYLFSQSQLFSIQSQIKGMTVNSVRNFIARQGGVDPTMAVFISFRAAGSDRTPAASEMLPGDPQRIMLTPTYPVTFPPVQLPQVPSGSSTQSVGGPPIATPTPGVDFCAVTGLCNSNPNP